MKDYSYTLLPQKRERKFNSPIAIVIFALIAWLCIGAFAVFAQSSESSAASEAEANVRVETGAAAGAAINNYGQKAGKDNRVYAEVATAPGLGGLALGGGHPCAYSKATAQVSIIGGGAGFGGMQVDSACMLMVMGAARQDERYYTAANLVIAGRDKAACRAMEEVGLVTGCAEPRRIGGKDFSAKAATTASAKTVNDGTGLKCQLNGKRLAFQPSSAEARDAELGACKAKFGI